MGFGLDVPVLSLFMLAIYDRAFKFMVHLAKVYEHQECASEFGMKLSKICMKRLAMDIDSQLARKTLSREWEISQAKSGMEQMKLENEIAMEFRKFEAQSRTGSLETEERELRTEVT